MSFAALSPSVHEAVPDLVRRLGLILSGLVAVIARRFLRDPRFMALIVPLAGRLGRAVRRFERAVTRSVVMRRRRGGRAREARAPGVRLPARKAWLVRELGWEAAGYGSQLQHLLDDPAMRAVLEAVPAVGRILRPICRMLGISPPAPAVVATAAVAGAEPSSEARPLWPAVGEAEPAAVGGNCAGFATSG